MKPCISNFYILLTALLVLTLIGCSNDKEMEPEDPLETTGQSEMIRDESNLFPLTILHTNDVHGRVMQFNDWGNTCDPEDIEAGECFGGVARRATKINEIREEKDNVLLLDAGDEFQGTLFYTQFRGLAAQAFMNYMEYDAMTFGNHEFDDGVQVLSDFAAGLEFPMVSSNIDFSNEPLMSELAERYIIREFDGRKVGIIGYTTEDVPSLANPGPNVEFNGIEESLRAVVEELEAQDVNIIIALSHAGLGRDVNIAEEVAGIDVIVGGHTHSYLSNFSEDAEGPYPWMASSPDGEPVLVVTAKSWGMYLGELDLEFSEDGIAERWNGEPILMDASIDEDPGALDLVADMYREVEPLTMLTVGTTLVDLEGREEVSRHYECNLGNLICDALLWETQAAGTTIAMFNGGGIRSGIPSGEITMAQILEVLPFGDTLAYFSLTGEDLHETLEYGVSRAEDPLNEGTGRFLQVAGLKYTWDPSAPVGERIVDMEVQNENKTWGPVDPEEVYKIVTLLYIREGGDGYEILEEKAIDPYDFGRVIADILVDYLMEYSPISPYTEGRITRVE